MLKVGSRCTKIEFRVFRARLSCPTFSNAISVLRLWIADYDLEGACVVWRICQGLHDPIN
jgi:hypothetical protein